ncbi:hypothetical protein ACFL45_08970 [Candidatus Neomarinimicrobiota bacterium]
MNKQPPAVPNRPDDSSKKSEKSPKRIKIPKVKVKREGPSRFKRVFTALGNRILLIIICAVVVFASAVAGAVITYRIQQQVWEQKLEQQEKQWLVDKRIQLMERTIAMFTRGKVVEEMDEDYSKTIMSAAGKVSRDPTKILDIITKTMKERSLSRCAVMESRSEYRALMRLNAVMFGEETRRVVGELMLADPWWQVDSTGRENLLNAMADEFLTQGYLE